MSCVRYLLTKKAYDQKRLEKAIRHFKTSSAAASAPESAYGNGGGGSSGSSGTGHVHGYGAADDQDEDVEVMEVERTELELATEATVVRAKGTGRQARKELRQSMTR